MKLDGNVDRFDIFAIHGWAADREQPELTLDVDIVKNDRTIATVPARGSRSDVVQPGLGDGRKAFWFGPFESLQYGENRFEVRFAGTGTLVPNGAHTIYFDQLVTARFAAGEPMARSKQRWYSAESPASLTWGSMLTGDVFIDAIARHVEVARLPELKILEVGPGYGRLLATILGRGHTYRSYVGLELSEERVRQLTRKYRNDRTRFVQGDAMTDQVATECDLFICSATFEHLYPNFVATLQNVQRQLALGAWACVDFVQLDPEMLMAEASFDSKQHGGAFVRVYARAELERMFTACGFEIAGIASVSEGRGSEGQVIDRIVVCARNLGAPAHVSEPEGVARVAMQVAATDYGEGLPPTTASLQGQRVWRALRRLRNAEQVKPFMDRLSRMPAYTALKRRVTRILLGRR